MSQNIVGHFESNLGKIERGWDIGPEGFELQMAKFPEQPVEGYATYATIGMSRHLLQMPNGAEVRQEFVFSARNCAGDLAAARLSEVCQTVLSSHRAVLRGEVIHLKASLLPGNCMTALYASIPVIFNENFAVFDRGDTNTVIVWMIPIYRGEADFIKERGWSEFESVLEEKDPDLCSLDRSSVV